MSVAVEDKSAGRAVDDDVELPWDERVDDPDAADLIVQERPDFSDVSEPSTFDTNQPARMTDDQSTVTSEFDRPVSVSNDPDDLTPADPVPAVARSRSGWTIALLCLGLAAVACCVIIPQADANRRLAYEQKKLQLDLEQIKNQSAVNKEFLKRIATDPTLAERLAQRQMKMIPRGTTVLQLRDQPSQFDMSPFLLVNLPAPSPLPAYEPVGGMIAQVCNDPKTRLYLMGLGLFLVAAGLVMGGTAKSNNQPVVNNQ